MTKKIIIIGGGIGGLSCAYDLNKSGFDVELYERSETMWWTSNISTNTKM